MPSIALLDLPQMFRRDVLTNTAKLALDRNALVVVRSRGDGVERSATLGICVVMIVSPVTIAVVNPAGSRVDKSSRNRVA